MATSQPRIQSGRPLSRVIATSILVVCFMLAAACGSEGSVKISADDQDPACHPRALMIASSDPNFEWNETGMDKYLHAYETCLQHSDHLGD